MKNPLVSIIIPTLNSAEFIGQCLASVFKQTYQEIEVIVVDGGSRDETLAKVEKYDVKIFHTQRGRSFQKNYGAKKAKGKYLYFVDSDFVLDKGIVKEAVGMLEEGMVHLVEVHNTSDPTVSFWSRVRKFERDMFIGDKHNISPRFLFKSQFKKIGGFDEDMIAGEDYDIYNRLRGQGYTKIGYTENYEVHLGEPKTLFEVMRKHYFYGKTLAKHNKLKKIKVVQQSPIKIAYLKNILNIILQPDMAIGLLVYNLFRYISAVIGWLSVKIITKNNIVDDSINL